MVSDDKLREIIAGCEGAPGPSPGPWWVHEDSIKADGRCVALLEWSIRDKRDDANAAHIARLDPATVKAMAEELLILRAKLAPETDTDGIPFT